MANIDTYLTAIQNAVYGEEVRGSIVNAISAIDTEVTTNMSKVVTSVYNHRNVFRGKSLGTSYTVDQKTAISSETFDDLYIGDYWTINNVKWRIADIDYFYKSGQTQLNAHHVVVIPEKPLYTAKMNSTATSVGAYKSSEMRTTGLADALATAKNFFGESCIISHMEFLESSVNASGEAVASAQTDNCMIELMSERMAYGCNINARMNALMTVSDRNQFALFTLQPQLLPRYSFWLRDAAGNNNMFAIWGAFRAWATSANADSGVLPYVLVGGSQS